MALKRSSELDDDGYTVINDITKFSNDDLTCLEHLCMYPHTLHNNNSGQNDHKRSQIHFNSVPDFLRLYEQKLIKLFPKYNKAFSSIIKSQHGCKEQNAHVDYMINDRFLSKLKSCKMPPLNAILGLETGAKLKVYPRSHKLMRRSFGATRRSKRLQKKIKPVYVSIPVGSVLVFRGECVHAGCAYEQTNKRIHTFLTPIVERYENCLPVGTDEALTKNMNEFIKNVIIE